MSDEKTAAIDVEQNVDRSSSLPRDTEEGVIIDEFIAAGSLKSILRKLTSAGVEIRGLEPVPPEARTHTKYYNICTLFGGSFISILP